MYVIAGLGNPGREYEGTRHNVGFMTLDALADKYNIDVREKAFKGLIGKGIEPDLEVELDEEAAQEVVIPEEKDNQLQKAVEVVKGK